MVPLPARDTKDQTHSWIWCCLGFGKRYGQDLSIIPPAWWKGRCLCHFWKMLHAAVIEVGTEGLPDQWRLLHILKKEMGRNICWSRKRGNHSCLSPGLGGIPSVPSQTSVILDLFYVKRIIPELLDPFQPIIATPCIHIVTSKSSVLISCSRTSL